VPSVVLFVWNGPYGTIASLEACRLAQSFLLIDWDVHLVFIEEGLNNLVKDQKTDLIQQHTIIDLVRMTQDMEVNILADQESMVSQCLKEEDFDSSLDLKVISPEDTCDLIEEATAVLYF
jgi:sulfur relay (sulfurtransferase) DsrF/TusC family protein